MTQLGMGVMINMLAGNESTVHIIKSTIGKTIRDIMLYDDAIHLTVEGEDGEVERIKLWDDGQSCCESRYMTCDADLPSYVGQKILDYELRDMPDGSADYDYHEQQALVIRTTEGNIDFVTHVEHNGYYGGWSIKAARA
jgi:hypothetical protein